MEEGCSPSLLHALQKSPHQHWGQLIIELSMRFAAQRMKSQQCHTVLVIMMDVLYPKLTMGLHYFIPNASRFNIWKRSIYPTLHYFGLIVLKRAESMSLMHDASTKFTEFEKRTVFGASMDAIFKSTHGNIRAKFPIYIGPLAKGDAVSENNVIGERGLQSELGKGVRLSALSTTAGIHDNAARKTTKIFRDRRSKQVIEAKALYEAHGDKLEDCPKDKRFLLEDWLNLADNIKLNINEFGVFNCIGHCLHLIGAASWGKTENDVIRAHMKTKGESMESFKSPQESLRSWVKLFAGGGNAYEYHLNEHIAYTQHNKMIEADPEAALDGVSKELLGLPNEKGSRQNIYNAIAAAALAQISEMLLYLELRVNTGNKLIMEAYAGMSDYNVVTAMKSRTYFYCSFIAPMVHFTHSTSVRRTMVGTIMNVAKQWIEKARGLSPDCSVKDIPQLEELSKSIIKAVEQLPDEPVEDFVTW